MFSPSDSRRPASNLQPAAYKTAALPIELRRRNDEFDSVRGQARTRALAGTGSRLAGRKALPRQFTQFSL